MTLFARIAALVGGLLLLLGSALISLGFAIAAPLGVFVAHRIRAASGRRLDLWESWMGAVSGVIIALAIGGGVLATKMPADTWRRMQQAADSASTETARRPQPAWLNRIAPSARRYDVKPHGPSKFDTAKMLWGMAIGAGIVGAFIGTIGWYGTMLVVFCFTGRWSHAAASPMDVFAPDTSTPEGAS